MTQHAGADVALARGRDIVSRWCSLAEQRLDHLTELYETGRWRRYHTEQDFLENIREAKAAVELWRDLEMREARLDNHAVDLSWLGRRQSALPLHKRLASAPETVPVAAAPPNDVPSDVLLALESVLGVSAQAPSIPDAPALDDVTIPLLDLDAIERRYPLLRNAL